MKAEDTVMTPQMLDNFKYWYDKYHGVRDIEAITEAQAEISFKVGKTLGVAETMKLSLEAMEDMKRAGRREVAVFVDNFAGIKHNPEWQAQKKMWGI